MSDARVRLVIVDAKNRFLRKKPVYLILRVFHCNCFFFFLHYFQLTRQGALLLVLYTVSNWYFLDEIGKLFSCSWYIIDLIIFYSLLVLTAESRIKLILLFSLNRIVHCRETWKSYKIITIK